MPKQIADKGATEAFLKLHVSETSEQCLPWPFGKRQAGYGLAVVGGVQKHASRWMCILAHGDAPTESHQAAHSCGNPECVNPRHLRWATPKENCADKYTHGTHIFGEASGKTPLSEDDVRAIRSAPPDLVALVQRYGVSKGCISKIRSGKRWPHVA